MVGIMVGITHTTIGTIHIVTAGRGRGIWVGTIHIIGVGDILITTILTIITTIDLRTTITHLIMVA